jgi:hypothetical protein
MPKSMSRSFQEDEIWFRNMIQNYKVQKLDESGRGSVYSLEMFICLKGPVNRNIVEKTQASDLSCR